jgi:hypothetical protein
VTAPGIWDGLDHQRGRQRDPAPEVSSADAMKPGIQCVGKHWIQGFMTFELVRRLRTVMLMVPVFPESGFLDVPPAAAR